MGGGPLHLAGQQTDAGQTRLDLGPIRRLRGPLQAALQRGLGGGEVARAGVQLGQLVQDAESQGALGGVHHPLKQLGGAGVGEGPLQAVGGIEREGHGLGGVPGGQEVAGHLLGLDTQTREGHQPFGDAQVKREPAVGGQGGVPSLAGRGGGEVEPDVTPVEQSSDEAPLLETLHQHVQTGDARQQIPKLLQANRPGQNGQQVEDLAGGDRHLGETSGE